MSFSQTLWKRTSKEVIHLRFQHRHLDLLMSEKKYIYLVKRKCTAEGRYIFSHIHSSMLHLNIWSGRIFFIHKYRVCPRASYFYEELTLGEGPGLQRGTASPWRLWSTFLVRITGLTGLSWMPADVPFPSVWHISIVECFAVSPCSTVELWGSGLYLCSWPRSNNEREGNSGSSRDKRGNFNEGVNWNFYTTYWRNSSVSRNILDSSRLRAVVHGMCFLKVSFLAYWSLQEINKHTCGANH